MVYLRTLALSALALAPQLLAQSAPDASQYVSPPMPATVSGDLISSQAASDMRGMRQWSGRMSFGSTCSDNSLFTAKGETSDCAMVVQPRLAFEQSGSRTNWSLSYENAWAKHARVSALDEVDHTQGFEVHHRFSRRFSVGVREAFTKTTGADWRLGTAADAHFGIMQRANDFPITPVASRIMAVVAVDGAYQLAKDSFVALTGSYSVLRFADEDAGSLGVTDNDSVSTGGLYSKRLGTRNWIGFNYNWQRIASGDAQSTIIHSLLYTHTLVLGPALVVSGFAGPQYSRDYLGSVAERWSSAAGVTLGWQKSATNLTATAARRISDGGGILGTAETNYALASVSQNLSRAWVVSVAGSAADSRTLRTDSLVRTFQCSVGIEWRPTNSFQIGLQYGRDWQRQSYTDMPAGPIDRNRVSLTVSYTFARQVGR